MSKHITKELAAALKNRGLKKTDHTSLAIKLIDTIDHFNKQAVDVPSMEKRIAGLRELLTKANIRLQTAKDDADRTKAEADIKICEIAQKLEGERSRILQVLRVMEQMGRKKTEVDRCKLLMKIAQEHNIGLSSDNDLLRDLVTIITVLLL